MNHERHEGYVSMKLIILSHRIYHMWKTPFTRIRVDDKRTRFLVSRGEESAPLYRTESNSGGS